MAAHRKLDRRRDDLCAGGLRKGAWEWIVVGIRYQRFEKARRASAINSKELRMKKQFILFCVTVIAVAPVCFAQARPAKPSTSGSNETAITDLEKSAWEAYKNKQADAFKKLLSKDYYGVYAEGIKNLDREVADMANTDLREYSLADMKVVFPSTDVAVITYKTTIQQTSDGKDMSGTYNSGSIWVKKGGKWLEVFHTEVKAQ